MSKEQIEKIANIIQKGEIDRNRGDLDCSEFTTDVVIKVGLQRLAGAKALYNAGYREQNEGEWIEHWSEMFECLYPVCSCCNNRSPQDRKWNYCPICGAKMKRE